MAPRPRLFAASVGTTWIDAHAHVFNAIDIPITEFIVQTRRSWVTEIAEPAIAVVAFLMRLQCPTAKTEIAMLANGQPAFRTMAALHRAPSTLDVLRHINAPSDPAYMLPPPDPGFRRPPMPREAKALLLEALAPHIEAQDITVGVPDNALRALAQRIDPSEAPPGQLHIERTKAVGPLLEWAGGFARSRSDIVRALAQQYRGNNLLAVAAWVDYSRPLGIDAGTADEPTSLADQIAVGAALTKAFAKHDAQPRLLLANFIGYDPMRALLRGPGEEDIIPQLERAVQAGEVVGIKLYPPMGFRPTGNAPLADAFPRLLRAKFGKRSGIALDGELRRLFKFCHENEVPIMAHCGDTNYPADGYGERASPRYWLSLLDDEDFPHLRLNLGHFGGIWSFGNANARDAEAADEWPQIIAQALSNKEGFYPNLYTDVAYASDLLVSGDVGSDPNEAEAANNFLRKTLGISTIGKRLMYGSDWQMVGQERLEDQYSSLVDADINNCLPPELHEDFRWRNAARFLGLGRRGATRRRLSKFLGTDADILATFNPG